MSKINDSSATLLVADDGSPAAQAAANVAVQIAKSRDLLVRGLYVVDEALILDTYADHRRELGNVPEVTSRDDLIAWFKKQGESALRELEARCQAANGTSRSRPAPTVGLGPAWPWTCQRFRLPGA